MDGLPESANWPVGLRGNVIRLIERFFILLDSKDSAAGTQLLQEVFSKYGVFHASNGTFRGKGANLMTEAYFSGS